MPNVAFIRPERAALIAQYNLIRDCLAGETVIKACRKQYLPMPNAEDQSKENVARYNAYLTRAVFYNVTRRTMSGLLGQVFMRDPDIKAPDILKPVVANATGSGVSLVQESKKALAMTLAYSQSGILVDFPDTTEAATAADIQSGKIRATITSYSPQEIINWRVIDRGAEEVLSLVVLSELYEYANDGFEMKRAEQFRVLYLDENGDYVIELWREPTPTEYKEGAKRRMNGNYQQHQTIRPKGADGQPLKDILFHFIGSENNDPNPDNPNFYDLASINVAHYRNSADYEETVFIVGQPTMVVTGLTQEWLDNVLKGKVAFGSRGGLPLPEGADAKLVQAAENTMLKEAMETKERQMVALGAKLVEQKQVQRTAFEAKVEATSESSTLASTTKNVSSVFTWALGWCAKLVGAADAGIEFTLNTDFDIAQLTPEERTQAMKEWQAGALTWTEYRAKLRKAGLATEDDEKAKAQIAEDTANDIANTVGAEVGAQGGNEGAGGSKTSNPPAKE